MDVIGRFQFPFFNGPPGQPIASSPLQCQLEITGGTSWSEYLKNVSNPKYGWRCYFPENEATHCSCANPLVPTPTKNEDHRDKWTHTFESHLHRIEQHVDDAAAMEEAITSDLFKNLLDVVFLGDSITERWGGEAFGESKEHFNGNAKVFDSLFGNATTLTPGTESSGDDLLLGMPLGISADRISNLLYRVQNGYLDGIRKIRDKEPELTSLRRRRRRLDPAIWWILIGTNDGYDGCLENHIIAGTIAIVEHLRQERPKAKIVINSILPRGPGTPNGLKNWRNRYQPINQGLECYAQGPHHDGKVIFFNATDLFLSNDRQFINLTLLPDELHPEEEGYWVWGRAIAQKIQEILALE
jgi:lysophospholipase L1-like esterase